VVAHPRPRLSVSPRLAPRPRPAPSFRRAPAPSPRTRVSRSFASSYSLDAVAHRLRPALIHNHGQVRAAALRAARYLIADGTIQHTRGAGACVCTRAMVSHVPLSFAAFQKRAARPPLPLAQTISSPGRLRKRRCARMYVEKPCDCRPCMERPAFRSLFVPTAVGARTLPGAVPGVAAGACLAQGLPAWSRCVSASLPRARAKSARPSSRTAPSSARPMLFSTAETLAVTATDDEDNLAAAAMEVRRRHAHLRPGVPCLVF